MKRYILTLVEWSVEHPGKTIILALLITIFFILGFPSIKIDTDPENMLRKDEPVRVFHNQVKKEFDINEMIVLGIVRDDGIFHVDTLSKIKSLTDEIMKIKGVVSDDVVSLSVTNNVVSEEDTLRVRPPLLTIPQSKDDIQRLKEEIMDNPLFRDRLVSSDSEGAVIYVPIESKDIAHEVAKEIRTIYESYKGPEKYYMAGLPLAEDTFGYEMFIQMAVVAPLTGALIMIVLYVIFRKFLLIIPSMIVAMLSVIWTMGAMIGLGFTVHIMSSMIPVFLMPIAVCDSVHILSDYYEKYPLIKERKEAIKAVFEELYRPMLFTSITTAVGFANLAWANIPPVRVFGLFVALGIMFAWLLTMTIVPACLMIIKEQRVSVKESKEGSRILLNIGMRSFNSSKIFIAGAGILFIIAVWGVTLLSVNDNPVKWFKKNHPVRVADRVLNEIIGGTYISYLVVEGGSEEDMKRPEVVGYIARLQDYLHEFNIVGKTTSVADVIKRINYVLHGEKDEYYVIPDDKDTIGQYLFLYLMSSSPDDLDNLVDYDYKKANIWVQLKSGDNKDMSYIVKKVDEFIASNPPPEGISLKWSGLPYLNITWQRLMVKGMLKATIGSWWVILILLVILFRSLWWGVMAMLPLGLSVLFSYGVIGFAGKDYDMPIAVCSTLALGLGVDFAIHFVERFRQKFRDSRDLVKSMEWTTGGDPALAIFRNAVVVGLGFLPLVIATLTPYVTVGLFFGSIAFFSGVTTLILLPAIVGGFRNVLVK